MHVEIIFALPIIILTQVLASSVGHYKLFNVCNVESWEWPGDAVTQVVHYD